MTDTTGSETGLEIAVIGMAGRFPGAKNIHEFWNNLKNGLETISFFSTRELEEAGLDPALINDPAYVKAKGMLEGAEYFDASLFGYTPTEAKIMDPQVRIFHECSWEALEDAGYNPGTYKGKIGIYAGATTNLDWQALAVLSGETGAVDSFSASQLMDKDYLTMRISFKLNLKGPSLLVQTACSTSLVAIHLASQGLLSGECGMALAGGVTITTPQKNGYMYQEGMVTSRDGHCRAFDAGANGFVDGNGAGVVVLKLLEDAVAGGDYIHAVIKGSAVNNDGNQKSGFTAPSIKAQREVIRGALSIAEVEPESIGYIEAHGTGTPLGDPIEIEALRRAFNTEKKGFCGIGSLKTNIGHLDGAAGVAGFIKTVLALKHRQIPPSLHFKTHNPTIDFENSPFVVNNRLKEWENGKYPLRAGVSAFGIGGTNAHVILEEAPVLGDFKGGREYRLIMLSAKNKFALDKMTENLVDYLENNPGQNLADVAYTLQVGRKPLNHRRMAICASRDEAVAVLSEPAAIPYNSVAEDKRRMVFMFAGLGSQYTGMGLELYRNEPVFGEEMDRCFEILNNLVDYDIKGILYPPTTGNRQPAAAFEDIHRIDISQLAVFIVEYALARLLMKWGIKPHSMIGYSFGEYMAACLSGVFSLEDALKIIVCRGKLLKEIPGGGMLSIPLSRAELTPLLDNELAIAIDNGSSCIAAGSKAAIGAFEKEMKKRKLMCMPVPHSTAMHSKMMEPILTKFEEKLAKVPLKPPQIPYISNLTGKWINAREVVKPTYWSKHLRETVRFSQGVTELVKNPNSIFIEIGPGRDLSTMVKRFIDDDAGQKVLNLIRPPQKSMSDVYYLFNKIGYLWLFGVNIHWPAFYPGEKRFRVPLPTYHFERKRYWFDGNPLKLAGEMLNAKSLPGKKTDIKDWLYIPQWKRSTLPPGTGISQEPACWLLFINESRVGARLVQRLKENGHNIIIIRAGSAFGSLSSGEYTVNCGESDDYDKLFKELIKSGNIPVNIVHLWGLTANGDGNDGSTLENINPVQDLGLYSLLNIAQSIGRNSISGNIKMGVITDNMQPVTGDEVLCPGKATILGPVKVIPLEYPNIKCLSIDIFEPGPDQRKMKFIIDNLLKEFSADFPGNRVVAYRGTYRWVEGYEPIRLDSSSQEAVLKEKGVYLVTGGFGGMGFTLVEHLAETKKARLILVDILTPPQGEKLDEWLFSQNRKKDIQLKKQKIEALEKCGAEIQIHDADVSDYRRMKEVISQAEERFGKIDGVIHTAGLIDYAGVIQRRTREMTEELLAAKVRGTLVLDTLLKNRGIDFMVLFSSVGNIFYKMKFGQVGYNAGHEFLAVFAHQKQKQGIFTVTIDWNDWLERGMAVRAAENTGSRHEESHVDKLLSITPAEGIEVFKRILGDDLLCRVMVSPVDVGTAIDFMNRPPGEIPGTDSLDSPGEEDTSQLLFERPRLSTPYKAPSTDIQHTIARIWETFFGLKQVGIQDDFFELGGDSLKAMNVSGLIQKELNVEIAVAEFFKWQTVEGLANYVTTGGGQKDDFPLEPAEKKEYYPVSSAQRRLYVLQQMGEQNIGYNEHLAMELEGHLVKERFEETFKRIIRRHESFRTSFQFIGGKPVMRIHEEIAFAVDYFDVEKNAAQHPENQGQDPVVAGMVNRFIRPFDLSQGPLLRAGLIKKEQSRYVMVVDMHHIIRDGLSQNIFINDFMALYKRQELPELSIRYRDFSQWQNHLFESGRIKKQEEYWLKEFETEAPVLNLPTDFPRLAIQSFEGNQMPGEIGNNEITALNRVALEQDATLFMVLLAVFNILLSKLSGLEDIVCGSVIAGRRHSELQRLIGMFVNTQALRNYPCSDLTFVDFLKNIRKKSLDAYENQDYQFETLVDKVVRNRDTSRNPLFDVMFAFHNYLDSPDEIANEEMDVLKVKPYTYENNKSIFDLSLNSIHDRGKLYITFEYSTNLFKEETIIRFMSYFKRIVASILIDPGIKISEIEIISGEEKNQVLFDFNNMKVEYPKDKTIHELFEKTAIQNPDSIALAGQSLGAANGVQLSYRELNARAGQMAHLTGTKGIGPERIVGIMVDRSIEMIVGLLGILKKGGAYLPIDPRYPADRVHYILADSCLDVLLTSADVSKNITFEKEILYLDLVTGCNLPQTGLATSPQLPGAVNPAYIIYTSGSSGRPKGVMIEHHNLLNYVHALYRRVPMTSDDTVIQQASFAFDIFVEEVYPVLLKGGKLAIPSGDEVLDIAVLTEFIAVHKVTLISCTPPLVNELNRLDKDEFGKIGSIRTLLVGGDELKLENIDNLFKLGDVYNGYGPTEITVCATFYKCLPGNGPFISIGKPLGNYNVYILDRNERLLPVGVPGQLCVGGHGVARGYLNNPELTAEKFIDSFIIETSIPPVGKNKIYKTGDLAQWLADGNIKFLGRIDFQVKIRGYRIELGEIENQLLKIKSVKEAVVVDRSGSAGGKSLAAYMVSGEELSSREIREYLSKKLPGYMIPSSFVQIEKVPLTSNGKVDKKALDLNAKQLHSGTAYAPAQNDIEKKMVEIWKEVLQADKVGVHDNFFDLGGNSIDIIKVSSRIKEILGREIPVVSLFRYPTIKSFVQCLEQEGKDRFHQSDRTQELKKGEESKMRMLQARRRGVK